MATLQEDLETLLNSKSVENRSNTPDFILAEYMLSCLRAFENASIAREAWYGMYCQPGGIRSSTPDFTAQVD